MQSRKQKMSLLHVQDRWDPAVADALDPVGRLVYRSNLLGADWRITNTGGGNTSSKILERDPLSGEEVEVLWVKGSGGDLRTAGREHFASLYQQKLLDLRGVYASMDSRGPKSPAEDAMVGMYRHCTFNLNPRATSIDTPLHAFVPYRHVDHTHPVSCIALATAADGPALTREVFGDEVVWVDWQRPGFELGLTLAEVCQKHPEARGVILGGHGLINWADDDRECYVLSLRLIDRAARFIDERMPDDDFGGARYDSLSPDRAEEILSKTLPWLRGRLSQSHRVIGTVQLDEAVREFVNARRAPALAELGTSCPDHFLRTKIKPLYVEWDPATGDAQSLQNALEKGITAYRSDYARYYEAHRDEASPDMRDPNPTVVLLPGIGMVAWGKTKSESRVTAEFYKAAIEVMRGAEAISTYTALPRKEAFDIEYWSLEEAKLRRMPPEQELSRQIAVVFGGGSGIGRELVRRLIREGATVAAIDVDQTAAESIADEILSERGKGIGVAGSGISSAGDVIGLQADVTDRQSIRKAIHEVVLAYGGVDLVAVTAGLYVSPDVHGRIADPDWDRSFAVNVTGAYLVADEVRHVWHAQGISGAMVITTSANAVVAKRGSFAYDTSKAAANHLIRELAIELAPTIRVNGVAPATVVAGSSMFPRDRVLASLAKYELPYDEEEPTETLRSRLAAFYAKRTLTRNPITPADQAEAIFLLLSERRFSRTTGQIIAVDGGLTEAFLR